MLLAVRISSHGCTWEVWRALKKLELLSATPRATLTLLSCSPNFPRASITRYTHSKHEPILKVTFNDPSQKSSFFKEVRFLGRRKRKMFGFPYSISNLTAPFNNMRTLKFKIQPTVNQLIGPLKKLRCLAQWVQKAHIQTLGLADFNPLFQ